MADEEYNGWTNSETWALNLWLRNDEGLYVMARDFGRTLDADDPRAGDKTRDWFEDEIVPLLKDLPADGPDVLGDIGSLWRVNWRETADNLIEMGK